MDSRYLDLLSDWHPVLPVRELGATPVELRLYDKEIVLYRGSDGQPHALNNRCPHRKMRLALGRVSGDSIVCPYHGWSFAPDGSGKAPACPNMRVSTTCYSVRTHQGMLWLRHGETEAPPLPALKYEGYRPLARLFHRIDAPLDLLLDNMTELEHTASVHSIFGFDADRMSDVLTSAMETENGLYIYYEGPQRKLPFYLEWVTGISRGDRFVQHASVYHRPLHAVYDLHWIDGKTGKPRPLALKFVIFFNEAGPKAGTQTTYTFARGDTALMDLVMAGFGWVMRHHVDRELRADIRLVESLRLEPGEESPGLRDRFDRPLSLRRLRSNNATPAATTQGNGDKPGWAPLFVGTGPNQQLAMNQHAK